MLTQLWLFSAMVLPPAANVNVMGFVAEIPDTPMTDIVAVPVQVPANAGGTVGPVAGAEAGAELLAWLEAEVPAVGELPPDPPLAAGCLVSSRTPATMSAATTAPLPAATASPRRDRADRVGGRPGANADPAMAGTESAGKPGPGRRGSV